mgnify:CR=1 FL=1
MALIKSVRGFTPQIGKDCFLADNATIIGDTVIGDECSIWFNTVLRGDVNSIRIGNRVNIQDGSVLHTLIRNRPSKSATMSRSVTMSPSTARPCATVH